MLTKRPSVKVPAPGGLELTSAITPPATAAAAKIMAANNRPLPRNTVANLLSLSCQ